MSAHRIARGIFQDQYGYFVIWPLLGRLRKKRFPPDTPVTQLKAYRRQQVDLAIQRKQTQGTGRIARDIVRFLRQRKGRPGYVSDRGKLRAWARRFPHQSRWALTREDCAIAVAEWLDQGYSAWEIRKRVRLFKALYRALDGKYLETPLDDLVLPPIPKARPVPVPDSVIRSVALELARHERLRYLRTAKTRARFLVLATTGMRPAQLKRTQPHDVDLDQRVWFVPPSKGDNGTLVYLNDDMRAAWELFRTAAAWGRYDTRNFGRTLQRCGWPAGVRPYTLRHSVGISLSHLGVDLGDIQAHYGHTTPTTTRIYVPTEFQKAKQASERIEGRIGGCGKEYWQVFAGPPPRSPQFAPVLTGRPNSEDPAVADPETAKRA
jgi:integrase